MYFFFLLWSQIPFSSGTLLMGCFFFFCIGLSKAITNYSRLVHNYSEKMDAEYITRMHIHLSFPGKVLHQNKWSHLRFLVVEWRTGIKRRNQRQTLRGWLLQDRYVTVERNVYCYYCNSSDIFIKTKTNLKLSFDHSFLGTWPCRLYLILFPVFLFWDWCTKERCSVTLSCSAATSNFSARMYRRDYCRGISRLYKITSSVPWLHECLCGSCGAWPGFEPTLQTVSCLVTGWAWHFHSQAAVGEGARIPAVKEEKFYSWIAFSLLDIGRASLLYQKQVFIILMNCSCCVYVLSVKSNGAFKLDSYSF